MRFHLESFEIFTFHLLSSLSKNSSVNLRDLESKLGGSFSE
jgi:hypothetical protein